MPTLFPWSLTWLEALLCVCAITYMALPRLYQPIMGHFPDPHLLIQMLAMAIYCSVKILCQPRERKSEHLHGFLASQQFLTLMHIITSQTMTLFDHFALELNDIVQPLYNIITHDRSSQPFHQSTFEMTILTEIR